MVSLWIDNVCVKSQYAPSAYGRTENWTFRLGDIDADIDEVQISRTVRPPDPPEEFAVDEHTLALYHFNGNYQDAGPFGLHLTASGNTNRVATNLEWMDRPVGEVARFTNLGDTLTVTIPNSLLSPETAANNLTLEAWIFPRAYKAYGTGASILSLYQHWDSGLCVIQDKWAAPSQPLIMVGGNQVLSNTTWSTSVLPGMWHQLKITRDATQLVNIWLDGVLITSTFASSNNARTDDWQFTLGNLDADIDEVRISNVIR